MNPIVLAMLTSLPILIFKIGVLVVGYLITKMGFELFVKGITGEFKFKSEIQGMKADLVSASPGTFFVLMGAMLIAFAILKDNPYTFETSSKINSEQPVVTSKLPDELPEDLL